MADHCVTIFRQYACQPSDCVAISSDNKTFYLHQNVLKTNKYFNAMLSSNMIEARTETMHLPETAEILDAVFSYIYTHLVCIENEEKLAEVFFAATKYSVVGLLRLMEVKISRRITINNAVQTLLLAEQFYSTYITMSAMSFIDSNIAAVRQTEDWNLLTHDLKDRIIDYQYRHGQYRPGARNFDSGSEEGSDGHYTPVFFE